MDIQIRHAQDDDYEAVAEICSTEAVIAQTTQIPHRDAAFWKGFYSSAGECVELVAVLEEKVVGHLGIILNTKPRAKHVASFGLVVHPEYHGKGVGTALMEELINMADNWLNLVKLELHVYTDNTVAVNLYKKFNFVIEGESRYSIFKQGQYAHSYQMARFHPQFEIDSQPRSLE